MLCVATTVQAKTTEVFDEPPASHQRPGSPFTYSRSATNQAGTANTGNSAIESVTNVATPGRLPNPDTMFINIDRNKDGLITQDEAPPRMRSRWNRMDANGDGKLDKQEQQRIAQFIRLRTQSGQRSNPAGAALSQSPDRPQAVRASEIVNRYLTLDRNRDGMISRDEIDSRFHSLFSRADGNRDLVVTPQELEAMLRR